MCGQLLYLYSTEVLADEVLKLRTFLFLRVRLRAGTSPPSQVEQEYGADSTRTSFPPSISHSQAGGKLTWHSNLSWVERSGVTQSVTPDLYLYNIQDINCDKGMKTKWWRTTVWGWSKMIFKAFCSSHFEFGKNTTVCVFLTIGSESKEMCQFMYSSPLTPKENDHTKELLK